LGETRFNLAVPLLALAVAACAKGDPSGPTSVYLTIDNGQGLAAPDELRLSAVGDSGPLFDDQRLPASGALVPPAGGGALLGTVTLYVGAGTSGLDIEVRGYLGGAAQSDGTTHVSVVAGKQVAATVVLAAASGSDAGSDGEGAASDGGAPSGEGLDGATPPDGRDLDGAATDAGCAGSSLSGVAAVPTSPVDLTAEGLLDWRHWGLGGAVDYKRTDAATLISDYTVIGTGATSDVMRNLVFSWTDGYPRTTVSSAPAAFAITGVNSGFEITAPAAASARTLAVYVSGESDSAVLVATLSDGCVTDYVATHSDTQVYLAVHRLTFRSATPGAELRVRWTMTDGTGAIGIHAATLY